MMLDARKDWLREHWGYMLELVYLPMKGRSGARALPSLRVPHAEKNRLIAAERRLLYFSHMSSKIYGALDR